MTKHIRVCCSIFKYRLKFTVTRYILIDKSGNDNRHDWKRSGNIRGARNSSYIIMYIIY